jgi:hypothetical protein
MKKHYRKIVIGFLALLVAAGIYLFTAREASAHEHRDVGPYALSFGWQVEPAYSGVFNGPEITILDEETEEPIVGAEDTLTLTVKFGSVSKELKLEAAYNDPGHYVAFMTPTRPGDYEFALTGAISSTGAVSTTVVNEIFSSAKGEFSTIEPSSDILFPDAKSDNVALQRQIDDLKEEVEALKAQLAELTKAK